MTLLSFIGQPEFTYCRNAIIFIGPTRIHLKNVLNRLTSQNELTSPIAANFIEVM